MDGEQDRIVITQMKKKVKHGAYFVLGDTDAYHGPIRYIVERGAYEEGKREGAFTIFWRNGAVRAEDNYEAGALHGRSRRNAEDGTLTSETNYARGIRHGIEKVMWHGVALGGAYENGVKVGVHVEQAEAAWHIRRATYAAGVREGPCIEYDMETGDGLPTVTEFYRAGQLHGLREIWHVEAETLERTLMEEEHWCDGKKNGRWITYEDGAISTEKHYHMNLEHGVQRTYVDGQLMQEITYHLGTKHGRHRVWTMVHGRRIPFMDASYDNGFHHGCHRRMVHSYCYTESFWSDGTKELRHGRWTVSSGHEINPKGVVGNRIRQESNWHMGARHGISRSWEYGRLAYSLNFKDGKLNGECHIWKDGDLAATGNYKEGVPVGQQLLFKAGQVTEDVNYDGEGQFHGTCTYKNSDGSRFQALQFVHGTLHGRQCFYSDGRPSRVINMRDGHVEGRFTIFDERGCIQEERIVRGDLDFEEAMAGGVLCAPSDRVSGGVFEFRYLCADGAIVACKLEANGVSCECAECSRPVRVCSCACCCYGDYDNYDDYDTYYNDDC